MKNLVLHADVLAPNSYTRFVFTYLSIYLILPIPRKNIREKDTKALKCSDMCPVATPLSIVANKR